MKKITIKDAKIGKEYVTMYGKIIQLVNKNPQHSKVLVLATDSELVLSNSYPIWDIGDELEEKLLNPDNRKTGVIHIENEEFKEEVSKKSVEAAQEKQKLLSEPDPVEEEIPKPKVKKPAPSSNTESLSAKQLIANLLREGEQTRDSLAQAIIDHGLSKHDSIPKVKKYVSVALSLLKKRDGLNIESVEPGRYRLIEE